MNRRDIQRALNDFQKDSEAFSTAQEVIRQRMLEREAEGTLEEFSDWAGTKCVVNALIMCNVRSQGLVEDLQLELEKHPLGLSLVGEEEDDGRAD